jgi:hypothetical protein
MAKKSTKSSTKKTNKATTSTKKTTKTTTKNTAVVESPKKRYFKAIYDKDGTVVCEGRYSGRKPKQAACKALTGITNGMKDRGEKFEGVTINFCVIEQTRRSKNKKYYYEGSKFKLDDPVVVKITKTDKKTGKKNTEKIKYSRGSKVMKCSSDKCPKLVAFNPRKKDLEEVVEDGATSKTTTSKTTTNKKTTKKTTTKKATKKTPVKVVKKKTTTKKTTKKTKK